jgi:hypothetical protein
MTTAHQLAKAVSTPFTADGAPSIGVHFGDVSSLEGLMALGSAAIYAAHSHLLLAHRFAPKTVEDRVGDCGYNLSECRALLDEWEDEAAKLPTLPIDRLASHFMPPDITYNNTCEVLVYNFIHDIWEKGLWVSLRAMDSHKQPPFNCELRVLNGSRNLLRPLGSSSIMLVDDRNKLPLASKQFRRVWVAASTDNATRQATELLAIQDAVLRLN